MAKDRKKRNYGNDVRVKPGRGRKASDWYFETPKTVSSIRTIKIGPTLCKCLERAHLQNKKNYLSIGGSYTEYYKNPEINEKGETIYRILPAVKGVDMNLPKLNLYVFRRTVH